MRRRDFPLGLLRRVDAIVKGANMKYLGNCQGVRIGSSVALLQERKRYGSQGIMVVSKGIGGRGASDHT